MCLKGVENKPAHVLALKMYMSAIDITANKCHVGDNFKCWDPPKTKSHIVKHSRVLFTKK